MNTQLNRRMPMSGYVAPRRYGFGRRMILPLMLLCIAISAALCLSPSIFFAASPVQSYSSLSSVPLLGSSNTALRLMTFNIRHANGLDGQIRLDAIGREIKQGQADVVALQEVDRLEWRSGLQDQAQALARALGMHYVFAPAIERGAAQYGIALLSRYPLRQTHADPLPGGKEPRVALTAEAYTPQGAVTVLTTHLGVPRSDRERQMPELLRLVQSIQTPVVVMGDFNMKADDPLMQPLEARLPKIPLDRPQATVQHGGEIDHMFTNLSVVGGKAWTEATKASDHVPVFAVVSLR